MQVVLRVRPMNERELFTSDPTAVHVDEQDPQQVQASCLEPQYTCSMVHANRAMVVRLFGFLHAVVVLQTGSCWV